MTVAMDLEAELDRLGAWEKLEDLASRLKLPHLPEYELSYFSSLFRPELKLLLDEAGRRVSNEADGSAFTVRGRLRRLLGDPDGAFEDFKAALELDPRCSAAHAGIGELAIGNVEAERALSRALELDGRNARAFLCRAFDRLTRGRPGEALRDLDEWGRLRPDSAIGPLLAGSALERLGDRESASAAYSSAAQKNPVCSAVYLLQARASAGPADRALHLRRAYDVSPVLGFITLQIHRTMEIESERYVRRILSFAFRHPEKTGAYYRREATQSHFSHFPAKDYGFVSRLADRHPHIAWVQAFFGRAACYAPAGAEEGVRRLARAVELAPHAGWIYAWRANARRLRRDYDGSLADFDACERLQPFYHRAFVWRGSLKRKLGRQSEAMSDLDRAITMDPHYSLVYHERSLARRMSGDFIGAGLDLDRAFMLDARYSWVFKTGGEPKPQELAEGIAELDRAAAANPSSASLRVWRAQLRLQSGDLAGAHADATLAVALDPQHAIAWCWLGRVLLESGRSPQSSEALLKAVKLEPDLWIAHRWLAEANFNQGKSREAFDVLRRVLRRKRTTPWAHFLSARFHFERRRPREAVQSLSRALLLDGKYPEAYLLLAQVQLTLGRWRPARSAVEKCLEIAPNLGRAYIVRAKIHELAGRPRLVIKDYRKVLADFPYLFNEEERARVEASVGGRPG